MSFVLDSSISLSWCFEDERTPATAALLDRVAEAGATAPELWPLEVLNGLAMAERRRRIDAGTRQRLADLLHALPVRLDRETTAQAWNATAQFATRFRLTVYDATYLELAHRLDLPLASLDESLRSAGRSLGVRLLGLATDLRKS